MSVSSCPICLIRQEPGCRYPNYVCSLCIRSYPPVDINGDLISFSNIDMHGGFCSTINGVDGEIHQCFINGIRCFAQEHRMGGIIIQGDPVDPEDPETPNNPGLFRQIGVDRSLENNITYNNEIIRNDNDNDNESDTDTEYEYEF